jgi:hypothetical protein
MGKENKAAPAPAGGGEEPKKKKKRRRRGAGMPILGIFVAMAGIILMPTTIIVFFGMLPTAVAALIDRSGKGNKALTVGAMNAAGCMPFLLQLWSTGHTTENSMIIISDPRTIIVIYSAAGLGYLIEWAMTGIVSTIMTQSSAHRLKEIEKIQKALTERWGLEVNGEIPLDAYGFPLHKQPPKAAEAD